MYRANQLYNFLGMCENSSLSKEVLECGAGISNGFTPLLKRFHERGYKTTGIDMSNDRIEYFKEYCSENNLDIEIKNGNMTNLDFEDNSISFIYSYNSIFHMAKKDIAVAVEEMKRVLKKDGLCFVNFLSVDDCEFGDGEPLEKGEFVQICETMGKTIHSFYDIDEADSYFKDVELLSKERRVCDEPGSTTGYIDYIFKK